MAYDPVKAHEYYINYRKKGLKKGRKKGKGKTTSTKKSSLVGLGTGGLNDSGKMQWALRKQELQEEMNAMLDGVTDLDERKKIITDFQNQALKELQQLKADPTYATPKKASSSKSSGGSSKSSSSSSSKSKSNSDNDNDSSTSSSSSTDTSLKSSTSGAKIKEYAGHTSKTVKESALQKGKKIDETSKETQEEKVNRLTAKATSTLEAIIKQADIKNATPDQKESIRMLTESIVKKLEENGATGETLNKISVLREKLGV